MEGEDVRAGEAVGLLAPDQFTASVGVKLHEIDSFIGWRGIFAADFDDTADPAEERSSG